MGWLDDPVVEGKAKWESDPVVAPAPSTRAAAAEKPAIEIKAGVQVPQLLQPSANPYSAGNYPLGRKYTVGDWATFLESDILTGIQQRILTSRVTRVDVDADRVEFNNGGMITDLMGNLVKTPAIEYAAPQQVIPAEIQVGKKWTAVYSQRRNGGKKTTAVVDIAIAHREKISVPAGTFDTFRIEGYGWNMTTSARVEIRVWLVPGLNFQIKKEVIVRERERWIDATRLELVSLQQQVLET